LNESLDSVGLKYNGLRICELGNQWLFLDPVDGVKWQSSAKPYFVDRGVTHTSIDLNGSDGALPINLSMPITQDLGEFDVVTNFGTAEHVPNYWQCLRNIHNLCRVGGLMIHETPLTGHWPGHGYHYLVEDTFHWLAGRCRYDILSLSTRAAMGNYDSGMMVCAALQRNPDSDFPSEQEFKAIPLFTK
jgi:hypothetical protein